MLKHNIIQAINEIKPTEDSGIQLIVTAADLMVNDVLDDIHDMLNVSPYRYNRTGNECCIFCKSSSEAPHSEKCPYERLRLNALFFDQQCSPEGEEIVADD